VSSISAIFNSAALQLYSSEKYYSYIQVSSITAIFKSAVLQLFSSEQQLIRGHHGGDRMVVGFTTTCAISAYHH
jgi:hypothetical protein